MAGEKSLPIRPRSKRERRERAWGPLSPLKEHFPQWLRLPNILSFLNSTTLEIKSLIYETLKGHSKSRLCKYSSGLCLALSTVGIAPPRIFKLLASSGAQSMRQVVSLTHFVSPDISGRAAVSSFHCVFLCSSQHQDSVRKLNSLAVFDSEILPSSHMWTEWEFPFV